MAGVLGQGHGKKTNNERFSQFQKKLTGKQKKSDSKRGLNTKRTTKAIQNRLASKIETTNRTKAILEDTEGGRRTDGRDHLSVSSQVAFLLIGSCSFARKSLF